jgi:hypothetical protein
MTDGGQVTILVSGNIVKNIGQSGIRVEGSYNIIASNNISQCGRSAVKEEITGSNNPVGGICRNQIIDNIATNTNTENGGHTGIWLQGYETIVRGNTMFASGSFEGSSDAITVNGRRAVVSNNDIQGYSNGINAEHSECAIVANNIKFCQHYGIWLSALATGTNYSSVHEFTTIAANVIMNNGQASVGADPGVRVSASGSGCTVRYITINGNTIGDNQTKCTTTITSSASSGQKVVTVAKTNDTVAGAAQFVTPSWGFVKGMNITLTDGVTNENAVIASVDSETQITVVTNLTNSYSTSGTVTARASQKYGIQYVTASSGTIDKTVVTGNMFIGNTSSAYDLSADTNVDFGHNITS